MFSVFLLTALLFPIVSWGADSPTCEEILSPSVDASICNDIRSAVFIIRFAIRDIDSKVKETILTSLKEAQKILESTVSTTIDDVRGMFSDTRRKRSTTDMRHEVRALAEQAAKNIDAAVITAEKKIRSSITLAVFNTDIQNEKIKTEALTILQKVLSKRSVAKEGGQEHSGIAYDVETALSAASVEVKDAMKDAVTTSIEEYKKIMDYFASRLKSLFQKANFKGNVEQAEEDIKALAIRASVSFIQFYDSSTTVSISKAIRSVEALMLKFNDIGNDKPYVLTLVKILLEAAGTHVSEVVSETKEDADDEIRTRMIADAEKMLSDYQTIAGILKKHGV